MIEIYLLEQLAAFSEYGTLSAASEALHITQPSLSRSMQKLERELGVTLFERTKNHIALNENGQLAAEYAERILAMEDEMSSRVQALDRSRHMLSLGSSAPGPLIKWAPQLTALYSDMPVTTELKPEEDLLKGLDTDVYQAIILNHELELPGCDCVPAGSESLLLSLHPGHPAVVLENGVRFKDLDGDTFLMVADVGIWDAIVRNEMPRSTFIIQSTLDENVALVDNSTLPAFASDLTEEFRRPDENRIHIPFLDEEATQHFYCIFKKKNRKLLAPFLNQL